MSIYLEHLLRIARRTVKQSTPQTIIMGVMTKEEAWDLLEQHGTDEDRAKVRDDRNLWDYHLNPFQLEV